MKNTNTSLANAIVAVVAVAILGAVLVYIFAPEGADIAPLIGLVGPTVATLAVLGKVNNVDDKIDRVDQRTEDLTNGLMDAKLRAGVADVLGEHLIDPAARGQLEADRARRDEAGRHAGDTPA